MWSYGSTSPAENRPYHPSETAPSLRPRAPPASPNKRGLVARHYHLEPPYCAASLVARAAIDHTAALFFVLR
jgi:hypothetical protein